MDLRLWLISGFLLLWSCGRNEKPIAAVVNNKPILMYSVDSTIQDELYDRLFDIYHTRKIALDYLLSDKVLKIEAISRNISIDSLLKLEIESVINNETIEEFIIKAQLQHGFPDTNNPSKTIDPYSESGRVYVYQLMNRHLKSEFVASLKDKYGAQVQLHPPFPPRISTEAFIKYPLNKSNSSFEILILSDLECPSCKEIIPKVLHLIDQYKDSISFSYVHFGSEVNEKMVASDCLFGLNVDFLSIINTFLKGSSGNDLNMQHISSTLSFNLDEYQTCISERRKTLEKLESNITQIRKQKISRTPTLIIDGRVYYGDFSTEAIKDYIERAKQVHG